MLQDGLYSSPTRLYGYPLILAVIYHFFGYTNSLFWQSVNILIDIAIAICVFKIVKDIFHNTTISWTAYILYLFNPFTSAFMGVRLTEVPSALVITLVYLLLSNYLKSNKFINVLLLAFLLGYLPQMRPSFFTFSFIFLLAIMYYVWRYSGLQRISFKRIFILPVIFVLPFIYTVAGNYAYFKTVSFLTVDNLFVRELYLSQYLERSPRHMTSVYEYPPEVRTIYAEYSVQDNSDLPRSNEQRKAVTQKYLNLALKNYKNDPVRLFMHNIRKMWYIWEKHSLFYYEPETNSPIILGLIYWGNIGLLAAAFFGVIYSFINAYKNNSSRPALFFGFCIFLFLSISVSYIFSTSEERFSLPVYPMLYVFAGFSFWYWWEKLKRLKKTRMDN